MFEKYKAERARIEVELEDLSKEGQKKVLRENLNTMPVIKASRVFHITKLITGLLLMAVVILFALLGYN